MIYIWFVSLYLYTVNIIIISYCRIVYLNHIFHYNLCNEEIQRSVRNLGFYTVDNSCFSVSCIRYVKLGGVSYVNCI